MNAAMLTGAAYVILGLAICFAGYRFFRVFLMLAGFILGFTLVMSLNGPTYDYSNLPVLAVAVVAGIVVALLAWLLYRSSVAIAGGLMGASLAMLLVNSFNIASPISLVILVVGVILGALLAFAIADLIIMISTAISGSNMAVTGLVMLFPTVLTGALVVIVALALAAFGFVTQWNTGGRSRRSLV